MCCRSPQIDRSQLGSPSPAPRQIFAIGLNYSAHAKESGFEEPDQLPPVFTKFVSSLSGPDTQVVLPEGGNTDWEVELVAIIGKEAANVSAADAWDYVAGLSIGQDLSERVSQLRGPAPQFGLGKWFPGFAPVGPWLVSPREFSNPDDLAIGCSLDGESSEAPHQRTDLLRSRPDPGPFADGHAATRRHHFHRHALRRGPWPHTAAFHPAR